MSSGLPENVKNGSSRVSPRGPVFLSYRHSDGAELAIALAWALRAAGVPVWLDRSDLPPGDTERRLAEAMQSVLSGAVLLVTPDIGASSVIKDIELPHLLALEGEGAFTLSIASTIEAEAGSLDYSAPDRLLSRTVPTLRGLRQDSALTSRDIADIARSHCRQRMEALRPDIESARQVIDINLQTRIVPSAIGPHGDLVVRLRPPMAGDRRPHRQGLEDLRLFLGDLPHLLEIAGARRARVSGGAHLSVAFALGAALPTTLLGDVEVEDTAGHTWTFADNAPAPAASKRLLEVTDRSPREAPVGYASMASDLAIVVGAATLKDLGQTYRNTSVDRSALDRLMELTSGVRVSSHVPAPATNRQNAVIRRGMSMTAVAPVWEGVTIIPDEVTKAKAGQIVITAVMLYAMKVLRTGAGLVKQGTDHA